MLESRSIDNEGDFDWLKISEKTMQSSTTGCKITDAKESFKIKNCQFEHSLHRVR